MPAENLPVVSVVIPTRNRPELLIRAALSALHQTYVNLEVLIVIDGPDPRTEDSLRTISDPRLQVLALPAYSGGSVARNAGVSAAQGRWVAFLDDDDEWLPAKIAKQLQVAESSKFLYPIVSTQVIARSPGGDRIWPRKPPSQPLSEYLLSRNSFSYGEGLLQTTTLFAPRKLLLERPFTPGLKRYQDWDWLLRAVQFPGAGIEFIAEPLAVWHLAQSGPSISRSHDWQFSLKWIRTNRSLVTPRAYAGFIASRVSSEASAQGAWSAFPGLIWEMISAGRPRPIDGMLYLGMWLPATFRKKLALSVGKLL